MAESTFPPIGGDKLLKLILQLVRYDIPPLIVGKSSIGKSYTIIELTKKWRMPSSMLYIGSEKPENIEGLAKLISKEYDGTDKSKGADILKFLKPYWFPNTDTISVQVANGYRIFSDYSNNYYDNPNLQFGWSYKCLHQILIGLMEIGFKGEETKLSVSLVDGGRANALSTSATPQTLNSKPFTFERGPITAVQAETNYEYTLDVQQAGRDDIRDMCMFLCTVLGYGNYWLILDELDKVDENEKDKYAPLLHIVRERTLKNWTLREINDKEGLDIPLAISNEYYQDIAVKIANQIQQGLPLLDCRVIGIANASDQIEEALFRRFAQVIMDSSMSIYPPTKEAGVIKKCVKDAFGGEENLIDPDLLNVIGFLKDVNLQWVYGFFPKILNQTDRLGNFFAVDFMKYYNAMQKKYPNPVDLESMVVKDSMNLTAIGKLFRDNFMGGDNDAKMIQFFKCFLPELFPDRSLIGRDDDSVGGGVTSPVQETREYIEATIQELGVERGFRQIQRDLQDDYADTQGTLSKIKLWVEKSLEMIQASNEGPDGEYNQIPDVGGRMIPFIYTMIVKNLSSDKQVDKDGFNQLMKIVNDFFGAFLNKEGQVEEHDLNVPTESVQKALFGATISEIQGMSDKQRVSATMRSLRGFGGADLDVFTKSLSGQIYFDKYFEDEMNIFIEYTLGDKDKFLEFKDNAQEPNSAEAATIHFLQTPYVNSLIQGRYDRAKQSGNHNTRGMRNLLRIANLSR